MKRIKILAVLIVLLVGTMPSEARKKPVIGIVPGYSSPEYTSIRRTYTDAILRAGGIPFILPQANDPVEASAILANVDGVIFTGGGDIDPSYYGETVLNETVEIDSHRDTLDILYARTALASGKPILAICRGEQLINVVLGGSLYQDLPSQKPGDIAHRQSANGKVPTQKVLVTRGSKLHKIMGKDVLMVNSFHHQAVKDPAGSVTVTAVSEDGIVEAYESNEKGRWLVAVQFHPEMLVRGDDSWLSLFKAFVKASR